MMTPFCRSEAGAVHVMRTAVAFSLMILKSLTIAVGTI